MSREGMLLVTKIPPAQRATKLGIIIQKLEDPEFDAREIERYILIEMATVTREIWACGNDQVSAQQARLCRERQRLFKALRALSKQTRDASLARRREDTLNLHGPKFLFVLREITELFKAAMEEVKIDEHQRQNTIRHLRDILVANEERLIRELKQMDRRSS